jgi:hypothetical protein
MIYTIASLSDPLSRVVADDPVRPEIPLEFRVSSSSEMILFVDEYLKPEAVVCVKYTDVVPRSVDELMDSSLSNQFNVAVFYTIWSYVPGAGRKLIIAARKHIQTIRPSVVKYVTLSPPTEMARIFHLRNGAQVLNVNQDTVNYSYE